jgi:hypothetical protein
VPVRFTVGTAVAPVGLGRITEDSSAEMDVINQSMMAADTATVNGDAFSFVGCVEFTDIKGILTCGQKRPDVEGVKNRAQSECCCFPFMTCKGLPARFAPLTCGQIPSICAA